MKFSITALTDSISISQSSPPLRSRSSNRLSKESFPPERIYGTEFNYKSSGEIDTIVRARAGYGKVAILDQLQANLKIGPDHIIYAGDGNSDIHVMLHVNARDGFTIAVSESKHVAHSAKRTVLGNNAIVVLVPILQKIAG